MIESNIYLEMILHTNLDLTSKTLKSVESFPLKNEKLPESVESFPLKNEKLPEPGERVPLKTEENPFSGGHDTQKKEPRCHL